MRTPLLNIATPALTESPQRQIEDRGATQGSRVVIELALKIELEADGDFSLTGGCIAVRAYRV